MPQGPAPITGAALPRVEAAAEHRDAREPRRSDAERGGGGGAQIGRGVIEGEPQLLDAQHRRRRSPGGKPVKRAAAARSAAGGRSAAGRQ
jgi:hypothetical protein